jgi:YVTN family beta-propeller protein
MFRAFNTDGSPNRRQENWIWGDGQIGSASIHDYAAPGDYSVTCVVISSGGAPTPTVASDPSAPHPIHILEDTLVYPDTIVATIAAGPRVRDWACVLPDGSRLYVTDAAADSVSVIDTHTNTVTAVVAVPDSPTCCLASNSGQYVYVSCLTACSVAVIGTQEDSIVGTIPIAGRPGRLAILPNDSLLLVAHTDSGIVSVIRTSDDSCVARVRTDGIPASLTVKPGGQFVYTTSETGNRLYVIRTSDNTIVSSAALSGGPSDALFSPSGDTVYVACPTASELVLLRTSDLSTVGSVKYDSMNFIGPLHTAMLPGSACLYVSSLKTGAGSAILRRSDNYLLRLTGIGKSRVAVPLPDGSRVYVPATAGVVVLGLRSSR